MRPARPVPVRIRIRAAYPARQGAAPGGAPPVGGRSACSAHPNPWARCRNASTTPGDANDRARTRGGVAGRRVRTERPSRPAPTAQPRRAVTAARRMTCPCHAHRVRLMDRRGNERTAGLPAWWHDRRAPGPTSQEHSGGRGPGSAATAASHRSSPSAGPVACRARPPPARPGAASSAMTPNLLDHSLPGDLTTPAPPARHRETRPERRQHHHRPEGAGVDPPVVVPARHRPSPRAELLRGRARRIGRARATRRGPCLWAATVMCEASSIKHPVAPAMRCIPAALPPQKPPRRDTPSDRRSATRLPCRPMVGRHCPASRGRQPTFRNVAGEWHPAVEDGD